MSAIPTEPPTGPDYSNPYRLAASEGPQTLAELRAALAADPVELTVFNAKLEAARFNDASFARVIAEARHLVALRTRPEAREAVADSLAGRTDARPVAELWNHLGEGAA